MLDNPLMVTSKLVQTPDPFCASSALTLTILLAPLRVLPKNMDKKSCLRLPHQL